MGGAKVSGKIDVIESLLDKVDSPDHRRRHGLHLPQGPGQGDRQVPGRGRPASRRPKAIADGQGQASSSSCPSTHVVRRRLRLRRRRSAR
ncbi:MAG: phosphoglycerate kinase [Candidatus Moduliflexus flocculans]|nr:phosphoglycerate kinase [Candidatus Moduliflexus flocculans]